jgi:hypothetical protein
VLLEEAMDQEQQLVHRPHIARVARLHFTRRIARLAIGTTLSSLKIGSNNFESLERYKRWQYLRIERGILESKD